MAHACDIDTKVERHAGPWQLAPIGELCPVMLKRVAKDAIARYNAGQRPEVPVAPPELAISDIEMVRFLRRSQRDVANCNGRPRGGFNVAWPSGTTEAVRFARMMKKAESSPIRLAMVRVGEALAIHDYMWTGLTSCTNATIPASHSSSSLRLSLGLGPQRLGKQWKQPQPRCRPQGQ